MFIRKDKFNNFENELIKLTAENNRLNNSINKLEKEKQNIKNNLENEHLENYRQHKKLLAIERLLNSSFGSYKDLLEFRNKVQEILKNELSDDCSRR